MNKEFEDTYRPLPVGLTIMRSKIEGLGLVAEVEIKAGKDLGETHVFAVSQSRREWVRTPLGGFINHSENPNCYISTTTEKRCLHTIRPINIGEEITVYYRFESYDGITA
tara:strand:+ start:251 stop:580 length:330 start_codon:yes stop_codon:yes gene_type:complete